MTHSSYSSHCSSGLEGLWVCHDCIHIPYEKRAPQREIPDFPTFRGQSQGWVWTYHDSTAHKMVVKTPEDMKQESYGKNLVACE